MNILIFMAGVVVGIFIALWILLQAHVKYSKRKKELYAKAGGLYRKAYELFESAKLWTIIGDNTAANDTLTEAHRLAKEAQTFEDEADGKKTP
jgi:hypothetical protein